MADDEGDSAAEALVAQLGEIPSRVRIFSVSRQEAAGRLKIAPRMLALLESRSLARQRDGQAYFDFYDLVNTQYRLGGGLLTIGLLRRWPKMLSCLPQPGPVVFDVGFEAQCPDPGHPGPCDFTVRLPDGRCYEIPSRPERREPLAWLRVELRTCWPDLPSVAKEIIDELQGLRFILLRHHVDWDESAFVRRTGLADCLAFSRLLVERGRRRGLAMRVCYGLLIAPPQVLPHFWTEIEADAVWVPIDALLIRTVVAGGALDYESWPPHRSPGGTFCRLGGPGYRPIIGTHRGDPIEVTYCSRLVN